MIFCLAVKRLLRFSNREKGWCEMVSQVNTNSSAMAVSQVATQPIGLSEHDAGASVQTSFAAQQAAKPDFKVDMQKLQQDLSSSLDKINQVMRDGGRNLNFTIDQSVQGPVVMVRNSDTGEVIRQIPNEAVVRVAHNIDALKGVLYNGLS
jgi:flagellar protein FlaG